MVLEVLPLGEHILPCGIIIDHLKKVADPDYLVQSGACLSGQELFSAAALLSTMQFMPLQVFARNNSSTGINNNVISTDSYSLAAGDSSRVAIIQGYFSDAIRFYCQLEAARYRFRHASACAPKYSDAMLSFVCKYPDECVSFLLDAVHLGRDEVSLLVAVCVFYINLFACLVLQFFFLG